MHGCPRQGYCTQKTKIISFNDQHSHLFFLIFHRSYDLSLSLTFIIIIFFLIYSNIFYKQVSVVIQNYKGWCLRKILLFLHSMSTKSENCPWFVGYLCSNAKSRYIWTPETKWHKVFNIKALACWSRVIPNCIVIAALYLVVHSSIDNHGSNSQGRG